MQTLVNNLPVHVCAHIGLVSRGHFKNNIEPYLGEHLSHVKQYTRRDTTDVVIFPATGNNYYAVFQALSEVGYNAYSIRDIIAQPLSFVIGSWNCETSWYLKCVYDTEQDPAQDFCIFCGLPDERK